jgi:hypothetical protein
MRFNSGWFVATIVFNTHRHEPNFGNILATNDVYMRRFLNI